MENCLPLIPWPRWMYPNRKSAPSCNGVAKSDASWSLRSLTFENLVLVSHFLITWWGTSIDHLDSVPKIFHLFLFTVFIYSRWTLQWRWCTSYWAYKDSPIPRPFPLSSFWFPAFIWHTIKVIKNGPRQLDYTRAAQGYMYMQKTLPG